MESYICSIPPKWCAKIADKKKEHEVLKFAPQELPCKVYVYCEEESNPEGKLRLYINTGWGRKNTGTTSWWRSGNPVVKVNDHLPAYAFDAFLADGKVIGEFICDSVKTFPFVSDMPTAGQFLNMPEDDPDAEIDTQPMYLITEQELQETGLTYEELEAYGNKTTVYGWHISNLLIYDKPKDLSDFGIATMSVK